MAKKTDKFNKFQRGLWVQGGKESAPEGTLRRARGLHGVKTPNIRSRDLDERLYQIPSHSLFRFGDVRFQASETRLYRDAVLILSGLSGQRISFVRIPPTATEPDYLFITESTSARKIDSTGTVTNWGIDPPIDGFTAIKGSQKALAIEVFDSAASFFPLNCTVLDETNIVQSYDGAIAVTILEGDTYATIEKSISLDLTVYADSTVSPDQDLITLWVRIESSYNFEYMVIRFDVGAGDFASDYYQTKVFPQAIPASGNQASDTTGVASSDAISGGDSSEAGAVADSNSNDSSGPPGDGAASSDSGGAISAPGTWTRLRIAKSSFTRIGTMATSWADVMGLQIAFKTNSGGGLIAYLDDMTMVGSAGHLGSYKYHVTYKNSTTGTRSNPNNTPATVENVERESIELASLPVSADAQVDKLEIWRTLGDGAHYFLVDTLANGTTTYSDRVADFVGMDDTTTDILQNIELPEDNVKPFNTFRDTWGSHQERVWWTNSQAGTEGLVYYSPIGRAEAVQGFIFVTNEDDPLQKGLTWNGVNWVFSESRLFRIDNTTEPFLARGVFGVPGTMQPRTVVATPLGICYQSYDGVRLFDGQRSILIAPEAIQVLMRGDDAENLTAFEGVVATYANDEYIISDGTQTLAANLRTGTWRDIGVGCSALFAEPDTGLVIASVDRYVVSLESESGTVAAEFEVESPGLDYGIVPTRVEAVYFDISTNTQDIDASLILDDRTITLGTINNATRRIAAFRVDKMGRIPSTRLSGSISSRVEVYSMCIESRDIPLHFLVGGRFNPLALADVPGVVYDLSQGIRYYGIDDQISSANLNQVPEIRRLIIDADWQDSAITPTLEFHNTTISLPPFVDSGRRIYEWDINRGDRLITLQLDGDFETIVLYQVALDVHIGEAFDVGLRLA